jgi:hypothetical protein
MAGGARNRPNSSRSRRANSPTALTRWRTRSALRSLTWWLTPDWWAAAILGVGAVSVALLLPGKGRGAKAGAEDTSKAGEGIKTSVARDKEPEIAHRSS